MGRKNREKSEKSSGMDRSKSRSINLYLIGLAVVFTGLIVYVATGYIKSDNSAVLTTQEDKNSIPVKTGNRENKTAGLIETGTVLPSSIWSGSVAMAYEIAARIPEVIDAQYCYCDCSKNSRFQHKTLLTCFTTDHGARCGICMNEVFRSEELYEKGLPIPEIKRAVDSEFSRYSRGG